MLNEIQKEYQAYKQRTLDDNPGTVKNGVMFAGIVKDQAKKSVGGIIDAVKYELADWKNTKLSDFKPKLPSKEDFLDGLVYTLIWAVSVPLLVWVHLTHVGDRKETCGAG